jgi:hypothetical protein
MVALAALVAMTGCAGEPYIVNSHEFVRKSPYFLDGLTDRSTVEICYHKRKATPEVIRNMAVVECRRFGKFALFKETNYNLCPLTTPVAAVYRCFDPNEKDDKETTANPGS